MLDAKLLRMFIAVYDNGSVTKAASELGLTQSTISHGLNRLRKIIDDELFVQSGRGIVSTPKADDMIPQAHALFSDMQAFVTPQYYDPATDHKQFTIAANDYEVETIIKPFLKKFRALAPNSALHIAVPRSQKEWSGLLRSGKVDLVLAPTLESDDPDLLQKKILTDHEVCFYDKRFQSAPNTIEQYCQAPQAIMTLDTIYQTEIDLALKIQGFKRHIVASAPSFSSLASIVQGTDIIVTMPSVLANSIFKNFTQSPLPFYIKPFDIGKIWHIKNRSSQRHNWLVSVI